MKYTILFLVLGISNTIDDCWFWFGHGAYFTPEYPECLFLLGDEYGLWNT